MNHLQNLIDEIWETLENNPGCLSNWKDDYTIEMENRLMNKIQENYDKKGIELLLEKYIYDLQIDDTQDNLFNWKSDLYKEKQQINEDRFIQDLREIWLENIRRGSNA